ncbi:MAG: hypothetical protein ACI90V_011948, partial [Bacillariaceae sp.]
SSVQRIVGTHQHHKTTKTPQDRRRRIRIWGYTVYAEEFASRNLARADNDGSTLGHKNGGRSINATDKTGLRDFPHVWSALQLRRIPPGQGKILRARLWYVPGSVTGASPLLRLIICGVRADHEFEE